ncbi:hypothetical protein CROQUDRAFT_680651 [Cronartium quercuum f. sp. fusiforme G11]|uniref:Uncharacterized protein n=1 Tax=Cronartium quercuum f. sp. fusiforme G11 TaxID=708437 RepID=A0A9P6NVK9_9BASI|nr:hypothetical protein CROQUDRAFT_680651 [Cronartium quercuum f. sp. fusiforme G11]
MNFGRFLIGILFVIDDRVLATELTTINTGYSWASPSPIMSYTKSTDPVPGFIMSTLDQQKQEKEAQVSYLESQRGSSEKQKMLNLGTKKGKEIQQLGKKKIKKSNHRIELDKLNAELAQKKKQDQVSLVKMIPGKDLKIFKNEHDIVLTPKNSKWRGPSSDLLIACKKFGSRLLKDFKSKENDLEPTAELTYSNRRVLASYSKPRSTRFRTVYFYGDSGTAEDLAICTWLLIVLAVVVIVSAGYAAEQLEALVHQEKVVQHGQQVIASAARVTFSPYPLVSFSLCCWLCLGNVPIEKIEVFEAFSPTNHTKTARLLPQDLH